MSADVVAFKALELFSATRRAMAGRLQVVEYPNEVRLVVSEQGLTATVVLSPAEARAVAEWILAGGDAAFDEKVAALLDEATIENAAHGVSTLAPLLRGATSPQIMAALERLEEAGRARRDDAGFEYLGENEDGWWRVATPDEQRADDAAIAEQLADEQRGHCPGCGVKLDGDRNVCPECSGENADEDEPIFDALGPDPDADNDPSLRDENWRDTLRHADGVEMVEYQGEPRPVVTYGAMLRLAKPETSDAEGAA